MENNLAVIKRPQPTDVVVETIKRATDLLAEAKTIQETKQVVDAAHAMKIYGERQKASEEAIARAHSLKVYAMAQLGKQIIEGQESGQILKQGESKVDHSHGYIIPSENNIKKQSLSDLGIDPKLSAQSKQLAQLTPEELAKKAVTYNPRKKSRKEKKRNKSIRAPQMKDPRAQYIQLVTNKI